MTASSEGFGNGLLQGNATRFHGLYELGHALRGATHCRSEIERGVVGALGVGSGQVKHATVVLFRARLLQQAGNIDRLLVRSLSALNRAAAHERGLHGRVTVSRGFMRFIQDDYNAVILGKLFKESLPVVSLVDLRVGRENHVVTVLFHTIA